MVETHIFLFHLKKTLKVRLSRSAEQMDGRHFCTRFVGKLKYLSAVIVGFVSASEK